MRILLLGCTGYIGRELVPRLLADGHIATLVGRKDLIGFTEGQTSGKLAYLKIDPSNADSWNEGPLLKALEDSDAVVNFVGEPIAEKRWTTAHCEELVRSRVATTTFLVNAMMRVRKVPKTLVNASAIGYYGTSFDCKFTENSLSGNDFLGHLCRNWEEVANTKPRRTRLVILRLGIVLSGDGGALAKMLPVFRAGLGGPIGSGKQWMSWIHRTDLCELVTRALVEKPFAGVFNAVAPEAVLMTTFAETLGNALGRPAILPVPGPILKLILGDGAKVVLEGQQVVSERLESLGFRFKFPCLKEAISDSLNK